VRLEARLREELAATQQERDAAITRTERAETDLAMARAQLKQLRQAQLIAEDGLHEALPPAPPATGTRK
jgi:hypothetical protein